MLTPELAHGYFAPGKQVVARTYVSGYVCETFGCRLSQVGCRLAITKGASGDANAGSAAWLFITCKQVVARTYASGFCWLTFACRLSQTGCRLTIDSGISGDANARAGGWLLRTR
jgi:hypothetical protein